MIMQWMDADNCRDVGRCGSCTARLSSSGPLSTPKVLGRLKR
jgi:ferredoxin